MKKLLLQFSFLICFIFIISGTGLAAMYSFGDPAIYWPGWQDNYDSNHNTQDVIGTPQLTGGLIITDDVTGLLQSVEISYDSSVVSAYSAGDLFFDLDSDGYWDYIVHNEYSNTSGHWNTISSSSLYQVTGSFGINDSYYFLTNDTWNNGTNGHGFRNDHPAVVNTSEFSAWTSLGSVSVTDFSSPAPGKVVFDFSGITSGTDWDFSNAIIAFTTTCGNDVIYSPVPEPMTILLLGFGMFGLGICSRRITKGK